MKLALVVPCILAMPFFLRVLVALVQEERSWHRPAVLAYGAGLSRSTRRGKLLEMKAGDQGQEQSMGTGNRIAL
jgi:hypothetical protein